MSKLPYQKMPKLSLQKIAQSAKSPLNCLPEAELAELADDLADYPGAVDVVLCVEPGPAPHLDVVHRQAEDLGVPALLDPLGPGGNSIGEKSLKNRSKISQESN